MSTYLFQAVVAVTVVLAVLAGLQARKYPLTKKSADRGANLGGLAGDAGPTVVGIVLWGVQVVSTVEPATPTEGWAPVCPSCGVCYSPGCMTCRKRAGMWPFDRGARVP